MILFMGQSIVEVIATWAIRCVLSSHFQRTIISSSFFFCRFLSFVVFIVVVV
jgi:hypothetical protein